MLLFVMLIFKKRANVLEIEGEVSEADEEYLDEPPE